eukprot:PhF_6_TR33682/c0_g1_i6/m.49356
MYQSLVQGLLRAFPTTAPSVLCLSQQFDGVECIDSSANFMCPFDIILTAMDLFRPVFDVAKADKKGTIKGGDFRWHMCVADLDAKALFIVDTMDDTFPIVHTVRAVGAGWVAASRSGRVVISMQRILYM